MMSVVDWGPTFTGPPQKSLVEPLHSLAVHFERSAGKDVKQKHKPSCDIKKMDKFILTKDSSSVSVVNVSSYYVYMMNGRMMNLSKPVWSACCLYIKFIGDIVSGPGTKKEFYRESVDGTVSTIFYTPPYVVRTVKLGSAGRDKITCIDPVASCKKNVSAHVLIQVYGYDMI